jgi:hypothetical protein
LATELLIKMSQRWPLSQVNPFVWPEDPPSSHPARPAFLGSAGSFFHIAKVTLASSSGEQKYSELGTDALGDYWTHAY